MCWASLKLLKWSVDYSQEGRLLYIHKLLKLSTINTVRVRNSSWRNIIFLLHLALIHVVYNCTNNTSYF